MNKLRSCYLEMLNLGMIILREAIDHGDLEWAAAEVELLHNVPSLIDEERIGPHQYFWNGTRGHYIEWSSQPGRGHARRKMDTYYQPLWSEMEPILRELSNEG